jgi:hypothetical protein
MGLFRKTSEEQFAKAVEFWNEKTINLFMELAAVCYGKAHTLK